MPTDFLLRKVSESDLPILFEHQRDEVALAMAAFPSREWAAFEEHWKKNILAEENAMKQAIVVGDVVAGYVCSFWRDGKRLIGYWLGREYWGKGYATAALAAHLKLEAARPLYAYVAKHNAGSIRVLEKCGFSAIEELKGDDRVEEFLMKLTGCGIGNSAL